MATFKMDEFGNIAEAIQNAGEGLQHEGTELKINILDAYVQKIQQDAIFRCIYLTTQC